MNADSLNRLRRMIMDSDNEACFIEREEILRKYEKETLALDPSQQYLFEAEKLLGELSTPLNADDLFAGRMLEGRWHHSEPFTRIALSSQGHATLPIAKILTVGLKGICRDVSINAERINTTSARYFEESTHRIVKAIQAFSLRYADAAEAIGKFELAKACRTVPYEPAYDLFSALQSTWMVLFVCYTVIGSRDFSPGRLDRHLLPFIKGVPREKAVELLAFFMMKFNEVTGTHTCDYMTKPIPSQSSKQYITIGPEFNELTDMIIDAAIAVDMPQPTLNFRLRDDFSQVGKAAYTLDSRCNFFNDKLILNKLLNVGYPPDIANNFSFTACNRLDVPGHVYNLYKRIDCFDNTVATFRKSIFEVSDASGILKKFHENLRDFIVDEFNEAHSDIYCKDLSFHFESLFLEESIQRCQDVYCGGADSRRWYHKMFSGIADMADSMVAVFRLQKKMPYADILAILEKDFDGEEELRQEIITGYPKFGNANDEADEWASTIGNTIIDAFEEAGLIAGFLAMPSFYSLSHHHAFGKSIGALPNGRKAGEQVSENQSPAHGMDKTGPTAVLKSVSRLPLDRCACGGLNLKFAARPSAKVLEGLIKSYMQMGGQHLGFTIVDRATLEDARSNPAAYRNLLVRITGYSEFFTTLSPAVQQEVINRTEY